MEARVGKKWFPAEVRQVGSARMRQGVGWLLVVVLWVLELASLSRRRDAIAHWQAASGQTKQARLPRVIFSA